ncbi:winged helix-turn-helix transcriptional regulator [Singulisphaera sp. PoT]|uniref:winged helix-turn-helix transcriptional regulator n=1 Tax=Singulisphaera sp. PoT TaxID=3411797 RepID=UPI003BF52558
MKHNGYTCGLEAALDVVNGKWKPLILRALRESPVRYGVVRRTVAGISDKVLIQHLRELEADEVIARKDFDAIPPRVEYSLTPFGVTLVENLLPLCEWGFENMARIERIKGRGRAAESKAG